MGSLCFCVLRGFEVFSFAFGGPFGLGAFGSYCFFAAFLRLAFDLGLLRSASCHGHSLLLPFLPWPQHAFWLSYPGWILLTLMSALPPCVPDRRLACFISVPLPFVSMSSPEHSEPAYSSASLQPCPELWASCPSTSHIMSACCGCCPWADSMHTSWKSMALPTSSGNTLFIRLSSLSYSFSIFLPSFLFL